MPRRIVRYCLANGERHTRSVICEDESDIAVILADLHGVEAADVTLNPPDDLTPAESATSEPVNESVAVRETAVNEGPPVASDALEVKHDTASMADLASVSQPGASQPTADVAAQQPTDPTASELPSLQ